MRATHFTFLFIAIVRKKKLLGVLVVGCVGMHVRISAIIRQFFLPGKRVSVGSVG